MQASMKFSFPRTGGWLNGDLNRLVVHLEHMAETASLLRAGGVVRERMALVAADHLAEVLLQDHLDQTFLATEEWGLITPRRFDRQQRERLRGDFSARVKLAQSKPLGIGGGPLLDARDVRVFNVAHAYRNALYHGDQHNSALGRSLAVEYVQAVGRALVRSWPRGTTFGGIASSDARLRAFRRLGSPSARSPFAPRLVAEECVQHLIGRFRVTRATLSRQLIRDLEERARGVQSILDGLSGYGLERDTQQELFRAALLWAAYRADPEIVRLQDERDAFFRAVAGRTDSLSEDDARIYQAIEASTARRRDELRTSFRAPVSIATAGRIPASAAKLGAAPDTATLLERYQKHDERLGWLEQGVRCVEAEFERMLERQIDLARGK